MEIILIIDYIANVHGSKMTEINQKEVNVSIDVNKENKKVFFVNKIFLYQTKNFLEKGKRRAHAKCIT